MRISDWSSYVCSSDLVAEAGLANVRAPLALDASSPRWPIARADAILCINMIHISPWAATEGLMAGAERVLGPGGVLYLYGPYRRADVPTDRKSTRLNSSH